jgi:hypothetical protein
MNNSTYYVTNHAFARAIAELYQQSGRSILDIQVSVLNPDVTFLSTLLFPNHATKEVAIVSTAERWERIRTILRLKYDLIVHVISADKFANQPTYSPSLKDVLRIGPVGMHRDASEELALTMVASLKAQQREIETLSAMLKSQLTVGITELGDLTM